MKRQSIWYPNKNEQEIVTQVQHRQYPPPPFLQYFPIPTPVDELLRKPAVRAQKFPKSAPSQESQYDSKTMMFRQ
jgi:hypothetical protein